MSAVIYTPHYTQFLDANGAPLNAGKLYTYVAGTVSTNKATYTAADGLTASDNPITLDSSGRATLFLSGSYKFVLKDRLGNLIKETDNITAFSTQSSTVDNITANFTEDVIAAGDSVIFSDVSDGGATKRDTVQGILDLVTSTAVKKISSTSLVTFTSGTGVIPNDDTIPQITEGNEFITLAYTPTSATNRLQIRAVLYVSTSLQDSCTTALFQDSTADALAANKVNAGFAGSPSVSVLEHDMVAGTTSSITFRIRCGATAGTTYFNSDSNTGARKLGGVASSRITITEYTP